MSSFYKNTLKSRKDFIINFSIDFLLIIIIFFINRYFDFFSHAIEIYFINFIIIWLVIGYIFGRFHNHEKSEKSLFINIFFKTILLSFCSNLFTYIIFFLSKNTLIYNFKYSSIIFFLFLWSIIFSGANYLIKDRFTNNLNKKKIWYFIGSKKVCKNLSNKVTEFNGKVELKHFNNKLNLKNLNKLKISGFCSDSFYRMSEDELKIFMNSKYVNTSIISIQRWCEIHLECIPPELVSKTYILRGNFLINKAIYPRFKKIADILASIILLILSSPVILFFSLMIYLEDQGSIFYSQKRIGLNGKPFTIFKLRSMKMDAEKEGPQWASQKDKRITYIGKIIRKTRIDELPQLLCVIKGEMSLIGPRPERKEFEDKLEKAIPNYKMRHLIKPGLSGWAQVNYPYGASLKDAENKLSYDLFYIKNFSLFIDLIIFMRTIRLVANLRGSKPKLNDK